MKTVKKLIALATSVALFSATSSVDAAYCTDCGGCGYAQCRRSSCITPCVALATIALVAIVAVAVQNSSSGHTHSD